MKKINWFFLLKCAATMPVTTNYKQDSGPEVGYDPEAKLKALNIT